MANNDKTCVDLAQLIHDKDPRKTIIAPVEASTTASRAYTTGEQFFLNDILRVATQDIAQGDTLTLNTNYKNADPVTTSIQNLSTVISKNGAHNILPFSLSTLKAINTAGTWNNNVYTHNGITYTVNEDNTVTVNGTNSTNSSASLYLAHRDRDYFITLKEGSYILSGCPSGGRENTYNLYISDSTVWISDFGSGNEFTVSQDKNYSVNIVVSKNTTVSNLTFKPMLRLASDPDATFEPWAKTNVELTADSLAAIDNRNILGAKNLCPNTAVSQEINNIVWTVNSDGTVTANGTLTANNSSVLVINTFTGNEAFVGKNVIVSGSPSGGGDTTHRITAYRAESVDGSSGTAFDTGTGVTVNWKNNGSGTKAKIQLEVLAGNEARTISNLTFKPMLRLASDPDATYVPYAMGNRELTQAVSLKNVYGNPQGNTSGTLRCMIRAGVVCFGADLNISATISANTVLAINLPPNIDLNNRILLFSSSGQYLAKVDADGQLIATTEIPSGYYRIVGSYITT